MSGVRIMFVETDGKKYVVDAIVDRSVMQAAIDNNVPGIRADCGGSCACGTCIVRVEPQIAQRLPAISRAEDDMLALAAPDRDACTRLSCQINVITELEGATFTLPEYQW